MSVPPSVLSRALMSAGAAGVLAVPFAVAVSDPPGAAAASADASSRSGTVVRPYAESAAFRSPLSSVDQVHEVGQDLLRDAASQAAAAEAAGIADAAAARNAAAQATAERAEADRQAAEKAAADARAQEAARASRSGRTDLPAAGGDPRSIARALLAARGQADQFSCLDKLWTKESGWSTTADNASSSAYGIPQALPGSKMASAGPDWRTDARTQIAWGLGYIGDRYGSPCAAWSHSQSSNWY